MQTPRQDKQNLPDQPAAEPGTYPAGMERERQEPEGGADKPKPSPEHRPKDQETDEGSPS